LASRVKFYLSAFVVFILASIFISLFFFEIYDFSFFLKAPGGDTVISEKDDVHRFNVIVSLDASISADTFLQFLKFLSDCSADFIALDMDIDNFSDITEIDKLKEFIRKDNKIYGVLNIEAKKSLLNRSGVNNEALKFFRYIKTDADFLFAGASEFAVFSNKLDIIADRIGFASNNNFSGYNLENFDALVRLENKYLLSAPFLLRNQSANIPMDRIEFGFTAATYDGKVIVGYDQKGRATFAHKMKPNKNIFIENFSNVDDAFLARKECLNLIKDLELEELKFSDAETQTGGDYGEEEKIIDFVYQAPDQKNAELNAKIAVVKEVAMKWKSYKASARSISEAKGLIVVDKKNLNTAINLDYQLRVIDRGKNLKRIPLEFILLINLAVLALFTLISLKVRNFIPVILVFIPLFIFSLAVFYILRKYLAYDFPVESILALLLFCLAYSGGLFTLKGVLKNRELESIYRGAASGKLLKQIAGMERNKNWTFESKPYLATFLSVDVAPFIAKDSDDEQIDEIEDKILQIENIIKSNYGVVSCSNNSLIVGYFGAPETKSYSYKNFINSAYKISEIPADKDNSKENKVTTAVLTKYEWFKFIKNGGKKSWVHIGNSFKILRAMDKIAKKFDAAIVISENSFKLANFEIPVRMLDRIRINNVESTIRIFELLDQNQVDNSGDLYDYFHAGLKLFESGKFEAASAYFRQCLKIKSTDVPSKIYFERCKNFIATPPDEEWDFVYDVD